MYEIISRFSVSFILELPPVQQGPSPCEAAHAAEVRQLDQEKRRHIIWCSETWDAIINLCHHVPSSMQNPLFPHPINPKAARGVCRYMCAHVYFAHS